SRHGIDLVVEVLVLDVARLFEGEVLAERVAHGMGGARHGAQYGTCLRLPRVQRLALPVLLLVGASSSSAPRPCVTPARQGSGPTAPARACPSCWPPGSPMGHPAVRQTGRSSSRRPCSTGQALSSRGRGAPVQGRGAPIELLGTQPNCWESGPSLW